MSSVKGSSGNRNLSLIPVVSSDVEKYIFFRFSSVNVSFPAFYSRATIASLLS